MTGYVNIQKRKTVDYNDRVNFACPYCCDSHKNVHAKRGNFYYNRLIFICFNCDKKTTFDRFCKDFNEQLDPDKKLEMIEHLNSVMTYSDYEGDFVDAKFENLIDMSELERVFDADITPISDFRPIQVNGGVYKYLVGRGIPPEYHKNIYQGKYWKNEDESDKQILNRLRVFAIAISFDLFKNSIVKSIFSPWKETLINEDLILTGSTSSFLRYSRASKSR